MTERPAGPILDELGVTLALGEHDRVTEVLLIAKTHNLGDGHVSLVVATNDLDWIASAGLHAAAGQVLMADPVRDDTDD